MTLNEKSQSALDAVEAAFEELQNEINSWEESPEPTPQDYEFPGIQSDLDNARDYIRRGDIAQGAYHLINFLGRDFDNLLTFVEEVSEVSA